MYACTFLLRTEKREKQRRWSCKMGEEYKKYHTDRPCEFVNNLQSCKEEKRCPFIRIPTMYSNLLSWQAILYESHHFTWNLRSMYFNEWKRQRQATIEKIAVFFAIFFSDDDDDDMLWKGSQQKGATVERNPLIFSLQGSPPLTLTNLHLFLPAPKVDGKNLSHQAKQKSTFQDMTGAYFARDLTGFVFERQGKTEFCTRAPFVWTTPHQRHEIQQTIFLLLSFVVIIPDYPEATQTSNGQFKIVSFYSFLFFVCFCVQHTSRIVTPKWAARNPTSMGKHKSYGRRKRGNSSTRVPKLSLTTTTTIITKNTIVSVVH